MEQDREIPEIPFLDTRERDDFVMERLRGDGVTVSRELVERIFELEDVFMFQKGITDYLPGTTDPTEEK
jgi:hypothetical protein